MGVVDCVRCDLYVVEDMPSIVPPGEFGGEGYSILNEEGFGDEWRSFRAAEIGHIVREAGYAWDVSRVGT